MQQVAPGDTVTVDYEGLLSTGELFETTEEIGPLTFQVGSGNVMPGLEQAVVGMVAEETKTIQVKAENGYGPRRDELVMTLPRSTFGAQVDLQPGMVLKMTMEREGEPCQVPALVTGIADDQVTVDFNHPLAGQVLTFRLTLKGIGEAPPAEQGCGCQSGSSSPAGGCGCQGGSCSPASGCGC